MWHHPQILWHHIVTHLQTILATNHLICPTFITVGVANQQICICLLLKTPCKIWQGVMEPTQWSTTHWTVRGLIQYYNNFLALIQLRSWVQRWRMVIGHMWRMQKLACMEAQWHLYFQPHLVAPHMHLKVLETGFIIWGKGSWLGNLLTEWVATKIPMFLLWMFQSLKSLGTQWRRYLIVEVAKALMHQFL